MVWRRQMQRLLSWYDCMLDCLWWLMVWCRKMQRLLSWYDCMLDCLWWLMVWCRQMQRLLSWYGCMLDCLSSSSLVGLARTVYIHRIWPYI